LNNSLGRRARVPRRPRSNASPAGAKLARCICLPASAATKRPPLLGASSRHISHTSDEVQAQLCCKPFRRVFDCNKYRRLPTIRSDENKQGEFSFHSNSTPSLERIPFRWNRNSLCLSLRDRVFSGEPADRANQVRGHDSPQNTLERDDLSAIRHPALRLCRSMIFSENRYPLFGIML
jgi:hypothetical protein